MPPQPEPRPGRTRSLNLHIRGWEALDRRPDEPSALQKIQGRLEAFAAAFNDDNVIPANLDPGIAVDYRDPGGGGGGPCVPTLIKIVVDISASGLPEAEPKTADE